MAPMVPEPTSHVGGASPSIFFGTTATEKTWRLDCFLIFLTNEPRTLYITAFQVDAVPAVVHVLHFVDFFASITFCYFPCCFFSSQLLDFKTYFPFTAFLQCIDLCGILARRACIACRVYATSMTSVCLSVCDVDGLWSHSATNSENRHMIG